ncbi:MAG: alpha/beta fold hydrolase [Desulfobulbaceae bacterium]|nr:alpha/beta fold hydrolase [Desulfobulbaceae bacterium]
MPEIPPAPELTAAFAELPGDLRLEFTTDQGHQVAYYLPPIHNPNQQPDHLAILYPGIGSVALGWLRFINPEEAPDTGWLMIDYPGRGESTGKMDPADLYKNSEGALTALSDHFGVPQITAELALLGHSFGSGAALQFAARNPGMVKRIVLVAPFDTLRRAVALRSWLLALILPSQIDNRELIADLLHDPNPPTITIFHGTSDQTLPVRMGRNLRDVAPEKIDYREFPDDSHVGILTTRHDLILGALSGRRP